ncbi:sensor histidine kinase [Acidipropionibacterium thoenii]|uniref:sensor histidine kinase n=1 Tax=Acidipropionibacterium thoenii TaxID=1751 RepID=UPI0009FDB25D|nr:histidine kinase [Acidipropionibacterium thoenii]
MRLKSSREGFWKETHALPRAIAITVSCFAILFNLDDLVGASRGLGAPGAVVELVRLLLCALALGVVCWSPRIAAFLLWGAIPVSIAANNIALLTVVGPIVCVVVTATATLPFVALNTALLVSGATAMAIKWAQWSHDPSAILWTGAFLLVASTALGLVLRAVLNARSERRRQEQRIADIQKQVEQAAEHERQRLAHDMHDYVAHELTLIVAGLAGARARRNASQQSPEQDVDLLGSVEQTSRKALDELRRVLRLLNDDGESEPIAGSPLPISGDHRAVPVATLIKDAAQDLQVIGDHVHLAISADTAELLPTAQQRTLLQRFLSEAVTNAAKHGGLGARVTIGSATVPNGWQVSLRNTIEMGAAGPEASTGLGIRGLQKEAEEAQCVVSAHPVGQQHEWLMTLTLPDPASTS